MVKDFIDLIELKDLPSATFCSRYGENVLEAKANPDWICPVCRGICNCSLCRQAKGWPPTGMLYKKVNYLYPETLVGWLASHHSLSTKSIIS